MAAAGCPAFFHRAVERPLPGTVNRTFQKALLILLLLWASAADASCPCFGAEPCVHDAAGNPTCSAYQGAASSRTCHPGTTDCTAASRATPYACDAMGSVSTADWKALPCPNGVTLAGILVEGSPGTAMHCMAYVTKSGSGTTKCSTFCAAFGGRCISSYSDTLSNECAVSSKEKKSCDNYRQDQICDCEPPPSNAPTSAPTQEPSRAPSASPTTVTPTMEPTIVPCAVSARSAESCAFDVAAWSDKTTCPYGNDESGAQCRFGVTRCGRCPAGACCPNSTHALARVGFWGTPGKDQLQDEEVGAVGMCSWPAERCTGYSSNQGNAGCSTGYAGVLCSECAADYYPAAGAGSTCEKCPKSSLSGALLGVGVIAAMLAFLGVVILAVSHLATKNSGGEAYTWKVYKKPTLEFVLYTTVSLQTLVQISDASENLEATPLSSFFASTIGIFAIRPDFVHASCLSLSWSPVASNCAWLGVGAFLLALYLMLSVRQLRPESWIRRSRWRAWFASSATPQVRNNVLRLLCVCYAQVANAALRMLVCVKHDAVDSTTTLLKADLSVECYRGTHGVVVAPLAWSVMLFYVLGFPVVSCVMVVRSRAEWGNKREHVAAWGYLLENDYKMRFFYFKLLHLGLLAVLGFCAIVLSDPLSRAEALAQLLISSFAVVALVVLMIVVRPFTEELHNRWKLPVRIFLLVVVLLNAFVNYAEHLVLVDPGADRTALSVLSNLVLTMGLLVFVTLGASFVVAIRDFHQQKLDAPDEDRVLDFAVDKYIRQASEKCLAFEGLGGGGDEPQLEDGTTKVKIAGTKHLELQMTANPMVVSSKPPQQPDSGRSLHGCSSFISKGAYTYTK